jgi:LuxR family maltose regulon positive regulatory protein
VEQLLSTKFFIPPTRPNIVPRPRLIDRLNACAYPGCNLILISAPAGFGKTTLASEWVQGLSKAVPPTAIAWLSLDEGDNDPARFLAYFIAALNQPQGVEASIGKGSLNMLQSPQPPPTEAVLTPLINEIAAIPDRIILVLDDYHAIESTQVDDILAFLVEYLPPQMHLVIVSFPRPWTIDRTARRRLAV